MAQENASGSTSKKKTASKTKTTAEKKSATASKTADKPKTPTKTPKVKSTTKASSAKQTKTTNTKTNPDKKSRKASIKELLFKKFDTPIPENIFRVNPPERNLQDITSPPFVSSQDTAEVERIRKLLFKKFDLSTPATGAEEKSETTPKTFETPISPVITSKSDPMATSLKLFLIGFVVLIALIVKVSTTNRTHYYLTPTENGIEISKGIFAPMGAEHLMTLPGAEPPTSIKGVYKQQDIYPYIFNYYVKKADELLEKPGMPDFEGIKAYLNQAMPYGITDKLRTAAVARLNNIDQMILLYKADVAASKETLADYQAALEYLNQANALDTDGTKADLIKQKVEAIQASMVELEETQAEATTAPEPSSKESIGGSSSIEK